MRPYHSLPANCSFKISSNSLSQELGIIGTHLRVKHVIFQYYTAKITACICITCLLNEMNSARYSQKQFSFSLTTAYKHPRVYLYSKLLECICSGNIVLWSLVNLLNLSLIISNSFSIVSFMFSKYSLYQMKNGRALNFSSLTFILLIFFSKCAYSSTVFNKIGDSGYSHLVILKSMTEAAVKCIVLHKAAGNIHCAF